jgi:hypothetical protein
VDISILYDNTTVFPIEVEIPIKAALITPYSYTNKFEISKSKDLIIIPHSPDGFMTYKFNVTTFDY